MKYPLTHLSDHALLRDLATLLARERATTAEVLAHIAEVDERRLYAPAGYGSMFSYCVQELRLSEEAARKRIHAARTARRVPAAFTALAEGRLHLSAVVLLAPYLTPENADELIAAATHQTKFEIERLIVERFPRLEVPVLVRAVAEPPADVASPSDERAPGRVDDQAPAPIAAPPSARSVRVTPVAPQRYALQLIMGQELHDKLRYAQELLSHQVPMGDVAQVLERALDALIPQLEKRKFAAASKPRSRQPRSTINPRYIPAHVKRAVWQRDGGQCTFASETGRRCQARTLLEFDHVEPVARGGRATIQGIRLRCRAHNQYGAECTFGTEFMRRKRERAAEARRVAAEARIRAAAEKQAREQARERDRAAADEVLPWLQALGIRGAEARLAAERCASMPGASLEERVRLALRHFGPRAVARAAAPVPAGP